jgi:hypothetical protein
MNANRRPPRRLPRAQDAPPAPRARLLAAFWLLAATAAAQQPAALQSQCIACHAKEAAAEHSRPHAQAGVGCVDCHGGDPAAKTSEAAKKEGTGYRGKLQRQALPELCGNCHADVRRMNPFGLPTDQLAQYRTSRHGEAVLERGSAAAATCVDCHGAHGILGPKSSDSPVHPRHVPETCAKCHADPKLVAAHDLNGKVVDDWRGSVHAKLLLEDGDLSAPQCATCHGSHGAVPPGFARASATCGKCHERQRELFELSPHARLVESGEFDACVVCHGNHRVQPASEQILERSCSLCHEPASTAMGKRDRLLHELRHAASELQLARQQLDRAKHRGLATEQDDVLLADARTAMLEMQAVQHSLDVDRLHTSARGVSGTLERMRERITAAASLERTKRLALLPVIGFLGLMSFGAWVRFRRIHESTKRVRDG